MTDRPIGPSERARRRGEKGEETDSEQQRLDRLYLEVFSTRAGREVLEHMWNRHVVRADPPGSPESALRESLGRRHLVLDIQRRIDRAQGSE